MSETAGAQGSGNLTNYGAEVVVVKPPKINTPAGLLQAETTTPIEQFVI
jgi:hypothetical protein